MLLPLALPACSVVLCRCPPSFAQLPSTTRWAQVRIASRVAQLVNYATLQARLAMEERASSTRASRAPTSTAFSSSTQSAAEAPASQHGLPAGYGAAVPQQHAHAVLQGDAGARAMMTEPSAAQQPPLVASSGAAPAAFQWPAHPTAAAPQPHAAFSAPGGSYSAWPSQTQQHPPTQGLQVQESLTWSRGSSGFTLAQPLRSAYPATDATASLPQGTLPHSHHHPHHAAATAAAAGGGPPLYPPEAAWQHLQQPAPQHPASAFPPHVLHQTPQQQHYQQPPQAAFVAAPAVQPAQAVQQPAEPAGPSHEAPLGFTPELKNLLYAPPAAVHMLLDVQRALRHVGAVGQPGYGQGACRALLSATRCVRTARLWACIQQAAAVCRSNRQRARREAGCDEQRLLRIARAGLLVAGGNLHGEGRRRALAGAAALPARASTQSTRGLEVPGGRRKQAGCRQPARAPQL